MLIEQHHLQTINQSKILHFKIFSLKNHHVEESEGKNNLKVQKSSAKQSQCTVILRENHYLN